MAFFDKKKSRTKESNTNTNSATIITACTEITGSIKGSDTIHVDGTLNGDIVADNIVVIGKNGVVNGTIKAQKIIVNGTCDGTVSCSDLEVMQSGTVSHKIIAETMILDGKVEGEIIATDSIDIIKNGSIKTSKLKSKTVTVNGSVTGKIIATELLEVQRDGSVEGEIVVKNIKTQEGGKMMGSMATYYEEEKTVTQEEKKVGENASSREVKNKSSNID